ncbi:hypothetical protein EAM_0529 [Erwinia amylovora ATCC 49946]|nr:hypothetical protein EAM_0529 [Erwinia amylovora ATCC 49946]
MGWDVRRILSTHGVKRRSKQGNEGGCKGISVIKCVDLAVCLQGCQGITPASVMVISSFQNPF